MANWQLPVLSIFRKRTVVGRAFNNNEDCSNHSELVVKYGIVNGCYLCVSKWDSVTLRRALDERWKNIEPVGLDSRFLPQPNYNHTWHFRRRRLLLKYCIDRVAHLVGCTYYH